MSAANPHGIFASTIRGARSHSPADLAPVGLTDAQAMTIAVKAGEISKGYYGDKIPDTAADITADLVASAARMPKWRKISKAAVLASVALGEIEHALTKYIPFERLPDDSPFDGMSPIINGRAGNEVAHEVLMAALAA